jgi:hypothetical protein
MGAEPVLIANPVGHVVGLFVVWDEDPALGPHSTHTECNHVLRALVVLLVDLCRRALHCVGRGSPRSSATPKKTLLWGVVLGSLPSVTACDTVPLPPHVPPCCLLRFAAVSCLCPRETLG